MQKVTSITFNCKKDADLILELSKEINKSKLIKLLLRNHYWRTPEIKSLPPDITDKIKNIILTNFTLKSQPDIDKEYFSKLVSAILESLRL